MGRFEQQIPEYITTLERENKKLLSEPVDEDEDERVKKLKAEIDEIEDEKNTQIARLEDEIDEIEALVAESPEAAERRLQINENERLIKQLKLRLVKVAA